MKRHYYRAELTWYSRNLSEDIGFLAKSDKDAKRLLTVYMLRKGYRRGSLFDEDNYLVGVATNHLDMAAIDWRDKRHVWRLKKLDPVKSTIRRVPRRRVGIPWENT